MQLACEMAIVLMPLFLTYVFGDEAAVEIASHEHADCRSYDEEADPLMELELVGSNQHIGCADPQPADPCDVIKPLHAHFNVFFVLHFC